MTFDIHQIKTLKLDFITHHSTPFIGSDIFNCIELSLLIKLVLTQIVLQEVKQAESIHISMVICFKDF